MINGNKPFLYDYGGLIPLSAYPAFRLRPLYLIINFYEKIINIY